MININNKQIMKPERTKMHTICEHGSNKDMPYMNFYVCPNCGKVLKDRYDGIVKTLDTNNVKNQSNQPRQ